MGGAIVLMLHRKDPTYWDGAILVAPMCKVIFDNLCTHCHLIFFVNNSVYIYTCALKSHHDEIDLPMG